MKSLNKILYENFQLLEVDLWESLFQIQEQLEETGFNPFQTDVTSILTQLSVEQDFLTGGDDNIFGETKESYLAAIDKVLERIENLLAAVTDERAAYLQQEKEFYTVLASKIRE